MSLWRSLILGAGTLPWQLKIESVYMDTLGICKAYVRVSPSIRTFTTLLSHCYLEKHNKYIRYKIYLKICTRDIYMNTNAHPIKYNVSIIHRLYLTLLAWIIWIKYFNIWKSKLKTLGIPYSIVKLYKISGPRYLYSDWIIRYITSSFLRLNQALP